MTHKERLESYQHQLLTAEQNLKALTEEVQKTQVAILQYQGAVAAMGAVLSDEEQTESLSVADLTFVQAGML